MAETRIVIPYAPRAPQQELHDDMDRCRFGVGVAHRRFGKSVMAANQLQRSALRSQLRDFRAAFIGPTYTQTKAILWDHLKYYSRVVPRVAYNESELRVDYPNGARVRLFGADNPDSLRGMYFDEVIFDEFDMMKMDAWTSIVRPALIDRKGRAYFIGTYKEENGPLGQITDYALAHREDADEPWFLRIYPVSETGIVPEPELRQIREALSPEEYGREMECKRIGAVKGSILGRWIDDAQQEGRIGVVDYDPRLRVYTSWDLGMGDPCAIWFWQQVGAEIRFIDYHEAKGEGLHYYALELQRRGWLYAEHIAPHDIAVRELGTGKSRLEVAASLGIFFRVLPQVSQTLRDEESEQIHAARMLLPRCRFDARRCAAGLRALRSWHFPYNEATGTLGSKGVHDWASHGAKSFCYGAMGMREVAQVERPEPDTRWIR